MARISDLDTIDRNIINEYSLGKINNEQYKNLKREISILYYEKFKEQIDTLVESHHKNIERNSKLGEINKSIMKAYSRDRLNNEHYLELRNEISLAYKKIFSDSIKLVLESSKNEMTKRAGLDSLRETITESYSDNEITKIHYDLLIERISDMTKEGDKKQK